MPEQDPNCVFCRIVQGSEPAWVVYEDRDTIAFLDSMPVAPGHILVCPKEHAARLSEMHGGTQRLNEALAKVARLVEERISSDYNIGANQGERAGQVVFHHHWHIIPRRSGDTRQWGRERLTPAGAQAVFEELGMAPVRRPP